MDFDALWERVIEPAVRAAGLLPVRADEQAGALILHEMIESLALADVVLADVSIANASVYYEVGVRHGVPGDHERCLLIAADWFEPVFDLRQIRAVTYPLPDGTVPPAHAEAARRVVEAALRDAALGRSPVRKIVADARLNPGGRVEQFVAQARQVNDALDRMRAVDRAPKPKRAGLVRALRDELLATPGLVAGLRLELLKLIRDHLGWEEVVAYVDRELSPEQQAIPWVREQRLLAEGKAGDPHRAIASLERFIRERGGTSERHGLVGGQAKKLWRAGGPDAERWLDEAVDAYTRGMLADLNDDYPSSNLPRLLRARGRAGDAERALQAEAVALVACERATKLRTGDEWLRPTLLGLAFEAGDRARARDLAARVRKEGPARWKLETTLKDLEATAKRLPPGFTAVVDELRALLRGPSGLAEALRKARVGAEIVLQALPLVVDAADGERPPGDEADPRLPVDRLHHPPRQGEGVVEQEAHRPDEPPVGVGGPDGDHHVVEAVAAVGDRRGELAGGGSTPLGDHPGEALPGVLGVGTGLRGVQRRPQRGDRGDGLGGERQRRQPGRAAGLQLRHPPLQRLDQRRQVLGGDGPAHRHPLDLHGLRLHRRADPGKQRRGEPEQHLVGDRRHGAPSRGG